MFRFYSQTYGKNSKKVIILLTGWGSTLVQYLLLTKLLQLNSYRVIVYSYDASILSPKPQETFNNCMALKRELLKQVKNLKEEGVEEISFFGISLGSMLALMVANSTRGISKIVINGTCANLAEIVWGWDKAKPRFKEELLRNKVTLETLKEKWKSIVPIYNINRLNGTKILMLLGTNDNMSPYEAQGLKLFRALRRKNEVLLFTNNYRSHALSVLAYLLKPSLYLNFLKS